MSEVTQLRPEGNDHLADSPEAAALDPEVYAAILDRGAAAVAGTVKKRRRTRIPSGTVLAVAFSILLVGVQAIVQAESWTGLTGFARLINIHGIATQGVPVTLDGVSTISALLALRAELSDESSGRERASMYIFTLLSCAANYWHGMHFGGIEEALYFAAMSLAVTFVFDMLLRQIRVAIRRRKGRRAKYVPQFGLFYWLRYPVLTFTAMSLAIKDGHETTADAIEAAKTTRETRRQAREAAQEAAQYADLPVLAIDETTLAAMSTQARLAVAFGALGKTDVPAAVAMLRKAGAPVDQSHAYQVRRSILEGSQS